MDEDTLARRRRVLGEDHPSTLGSANNLAVDLGACRAPSRPGARFRDYSRPVSPDLCVPRISSAAVTSRVALAAVRW